MNFVEDMMDPENLTMKTIDRDRIEYAVWCFNVDINKAFAQLKIICFTPDVLHAFECMDGF